PVPPWLFFIGALMSSAYLLTTSTGSIAADYPMAFGVAWFVLMASDFTLLSHPHHELQVGPPEEDAIENAPLSARVQWVLRLFSSPRGVGWSHAPKLFRPTPAPGTSRASFVLGRVASMFRCMLTVDVSSLYLRHYSTLVHGGLSFDERPWYWTMVDLYVWALSVVSNAVLLHSILSLVSVALHLSRPEDWTHLFGYWSDAYTIRRFWGRAWHQCLRRVFTVHGKFVARLGMKWTESNCLVFFLLQAAGITIEDIVIAIGQKFGLKSGRTVYLLGYAWTVIWFYKTLPVWWDPKHRAQNMFNRTFSLQSGMKDSGAFFKE
ncbi:hypothetical protein BDZ89DRAFT_1077549, partial [Hymenopellis radicata]